ncbi:MAG: AbrB family transcriptional regulator [Sporolactobacillus sp.]
MTGKAFDQMRRHVRYMIICSCGGFLLSLTGLPIGWMLGTLAVSAGLSLCPSSVWRKRCGAGGLAGYWLNIGQMLLGVQIGEQINRTIINVFIREWPIIVFVLALSVVLSLLSGWCVWRFSQADLMTSLYGTTPGGLSAMLGIAADVGADMAAVSVIQTLRVVLVIGTLPLAVSLLGGGMADGKNMVILPEPLNGLSLTGFLLTVLLAIAGSLLARRCRLPAPWLIGSLLVSGMLQILLGSAFSVYLPVWWPNVFIIVAQVMIGASVGARMRRELFKGLLRTTVVGLCSSIGLMGMMAFAAVLVSMRTNLPLATTMLAFAPGGIAEMAATSVVLHADATFVVTVQVLRVLAVVLLLPPLFHRLKQHRPGRSTQAAE